MPLSYKRNEDLRGYFQELARERDIPFSVKQISIFSINPEQKRGNHYHTKLIEKFIILEGECELTVGNDKHILKQGESFTVYPYKTHTFYAKNLCKVLVLSSQEFIPSKPDTFKE